MKSADESLHVMFHFYMEKSLEELTEMGNAVKKLENEENLQLTTINVKIALDDKDSRVYEAIRILGGDTPGDAIKAIVRDGLITESYIMFNAFNLALKMKAEGLGDEHESEDK